MVPSMEDMYNLRRNIKLHIIQAADSKDGWSVANRGMLNIELVGFFHSSILRYLHSIYWVPSNVLTTRHTMINMSQGSKLEHYCYDEKESLVSRSGYRSRVRDGWRRLLQCLEYLSLVNILAHQLKEVHSLSKILILWPKDHFIRITAGIC